MRGYSSEMKYYLEVLGLHFMGIAYMRVIIPFTQELNRMEWAWTSISQDLSLLVKNYSVAKISKLDWLQQARRLFTAQDSWKEMARQCARFS